MRRVARGAGEGMDKCSAPGLGHSGQESWGYRVGGGCSQTARQMALTARATQMRLLPVTAPKASLGVSAANIEGAGMGSGARASHHGHQPLAFPIRWLFFMYSRFRFKHP